MAAASKLYAQTLFDLDPHLDEELFQLKKALTKEYLNFFHSPFVSLADKKKVLDQTPFSKTFKGFLYQLTIKKRWGLFEEICLQFKEILDKKKNILRGCIYTARDLSKQEMLKIENSLASFFKDKEIILSVEKNSRFISGFRVEIEGLSFDDTSFYHLEKFKSQALK